MDSAALSFATRRTPVATTMQDGFANVFIRSFGAAILETPRADDRPMLWTCLRFPDLPLAAAFGETPTAPAALFDGPRNRPLIAVTNTTSAACGVRPGQPVAAARALCAALALRARNHAGERALLGVLGAWAYGYSDQVSLAAPDAVLLEVGASLRLFGGWPALQRHLRTDLAALGHAHALAVAPVAAAARVLARCTDGLALVDATRLRAALARVPLAVSGLSDAAVATLRGAGLQRLGDVFPLPRPELARRIGRDGLVLLDRLRGDAPEILPMYRPSDRFERRIELEGRIESWLPLLFPLRRLVRELAAFLTARDGGAQSLELVLEHEGRDATRVPVRLLAPQREADALFDFCRGRLQRTDIPAEVAGLGLVVNNLPPFQPRHRDLFEITREQSLDWPELAERLRARLGDAAVRPLATTADHRPERAQYYGVATPGMSREHRPRPLWLLSRPQPLRPKPQILHGPERIESGWWDGNEARRDYYVVRTPAGQRAWAYLPLGTHEGWMLHGWFA